MHIDPKRQGISCIFICMHTQEYVRQTLIQMYTEIDLIAMVATPPHTLWDMVKGRRHYKL